MVKNFYSEPAKAFMARYRERFEEEHRDEINSLTAVGLPEHLMESEIAKIYLENRYRLTMSSSAYYQLVQFLEQRDSEGGSVINKIVNTHLFINAIDRASDDRSSLANMLTRSKLDENFPAEDEGIPGHNPGSAFREQAPSSTTLTRIKLGPLPMEPNLLEDVMAELEEEDSRNPPGEGKKTLVQEFQQMIKKEENEENNPNRDELVYPESKMRDVLMEVHKVKENRDRYKIDTNTGGVAAGVSVCMWTFHNSYDRYGFRTCRIHP
jgi:transcription initiation factor TFIID subunit 5